MDEFFGVTEEKYKENSSLIMNGSNIIINLKMFLEEKDLDISQNILKYLDLITSKDNNEIDLGNLLINCQEHHIEALVFKIKNDMMNKSIKDPKYIIPKGKEYEEFIQNGIFNKIVPTFCQDIIASMIDYGMEKKYSDNSNFIPIRMYFILCNSINLIFLPLSSFS